jgi:hypothetical protein
MELIKNWIFNLNEWKKFGNEIMLDLKNIHEKEEYNDILLIKPYSLRKFVDVDNVLSKPVSEALIINYLEFFHLQEKYNIDIKDLK